MNDKGLRWHQVDPVSLCQHLHTNAACGLSRKAARSRFKKQGRNSLFDDITSQQSGYIKKLLMDPAILLMLFGAFLALAFLQPLQIVCTVIILILLIAALVRFLYRCDALIRITKQYRTPVVRVLRDGRVFRVSVARVVAGDILLLSTGDIVPGDCRLLTADQLRVLTLQPNENGNPIYKEYTKNAKTVYPYGSCIDAPMAENMLYGGSEVLCGEAKAVLVAIGEESYLGAMRSFAIPAEMKERRGETPLQKLLGPYLRLWSSASLILLALLTLIGLLTTPTGGGLAEYFFILCILVGASSPAVISLYLQWVSVRGRMLCMETDSPKNRAVIKSEAGSEKLAGITDLFVIGKRGLCDGITHFWSAFALNREFRADEDGDKSALQPLCEAMLLRHEADMLMPSFGCSSYNENDTVFLSELVSLCGFDEGALKVRVQSIEKATYPKHSSWQSVQARLQEGRVQFLYDNSGTLMRHCMLYTDGAITRAITPEYRSALRKYCEHIEENGCRALCVAKESSEGTLCLVGIIALRAQISAVLPSVVEELSQSGVATRFFLSNDDYARACRLPEPYLYCNTEHPHLTPALLQEYRTFIGFEKEELSALLPTYQKSGHRVAVLGGNANDRCFLRAGVLTFACDTVTDLSHYTESRIEEVNSNRGEGSRNTSQVLRRHADVIIERADRFTGGVYAALQAVSHSREIETRAQMLLQFWLYSQLARMIMTIFAVCTGVGFLSIVQMFLFGFAVEITALCFLSDVPIAQSALRRPGMTDKTFILQKLLSKESLLSIVIPVGITALTTIILTFAGVLTAAAAQTYLCFSLFFLQISVLFRIAYMGKVRAQLRRTLILSAILFCAVGLLTLLSVLIVPFGVVTGMGSWMVLTAILLPLCPGLYLILMLLLPFLSRTAK